LKSTQDKNKQLMKSIAFLFSVSGVLLFFSCGGEQGSYDAMGSFEATELIVSSEAAGKIMQLDVEEGQQLEAGQTVGYVDSMQLYLQKMSLLATTEGVRVQRPDIKVQIAALEAQLAGARREYQRVQRLLQANAATTKQLDELETQISVLQHQLEAQQSLLNKSSANITAQSSAMEIQVAQLEDRIQKCRIMSPITGTVINKYAEAGELANTGTPLFKLADLNQMYLRAYVTNNQLAGLKLNSEVDVLADAGKGKMKPYKGTVCWISDQAEFTPKTVQTKDERANLVYAIKIAVQNDGYLRIGMYGEVRFRDKQKESLIPAKL
jgi:HlyD family secretion protein